MRRSTGLIGVVLGVLTNHSGAAPIRVRGAVAALGVGAVLPPVGSIPVLIRGPEGHARRAVVAVPNWIECVDRVSGLVEPFLDQVGCCSQPGAFPLGGQRVRKVLPWSMDQRFS
jgi:hypothetical protein